jgi:hypothetical protein
MAFNTVAFRNKNELFINTDLTQIFVWNNRYENVAFTYENTGDDLTFPVGLVVGRVLATNKVVPWVSTASDGSQYPIGVLNTEVDILYGETFDDTVSICVAGDVAEDKVSLLDDGDTLDSECGSSQRTCRDLLSSVASAIRLVLGTQHTEFDNS